MYCIALRVENLRVSVGARCAGRATQAGNADQSRTQPTTDSAASSALDTGPDTTANAM